MAEPFPREVVEARATQIRFARVADVLAGTGGRLNAGELARNARLRHRDDRDAHRAAHLLVRRVAARLLAVSADDLDLAHRCPGCGSDRHGRPRLVGHDGTFVSLSHTRGMVAAIAATRPCGIDVERVRAVTAAVRRQVLTAEELRSVGVAADPATAFTRIWVAKEAMVKAGLGTLDTAGTWSAPAPPVVRHWSGEATGYVGAWFVGPT